MADAPPLQVNFRMPADLKDRLQRSADHSGRTLTAEIVHRLERSFEPEQYSVTAIKVMEEANKRTSLMQSIAENFLRWQRAGWSLFSELAELAGDRITPELREQMARFRDMPIAEARDSLSEMGENMPLRPRTKPKSV